MEAPLVERVGAGEASPAATAATAAMYNVVVMSAAFFFLFASYNTLQSYLSTTLPANLGFESLVVIYVFYWLCIPLAPAFCGRISDRRVLVGGSVTYGLFTASLIWGNEVALLVASAVLGFGAALLWVAQGSLLTACSSHHNRGLYAGIFWMGLQASAIFGPLASFVILDHFRGDDSTGNLCMYITFAVSSAIAVVLLCALRPLADRQSEGVGSNEVSFCADMKTSIHKVLIATLRKDTQLVLLGCAWTGLEVAFSNGEFFKLIGDGKDESVISLVFIAFGMADSAGGVMLGRLSDRLECRGYPGRKGVILFGACCFAGALCLTAFLKLHPAVPPLLPEPDDAHRSAPLLAYVAAMLFGLGDASFNTQLYAVLGDFCPTTGEVAFAVYQLCQQTGSILGFALPLVLPLESSNWPLVIQASVLIPATLMFCALQMPTSNIEHAPQLDQLKQER